jgi:hypothetical protein
MKRLGSHSGCPPSLISRHPSELTIIPNALERYLDMSIEGWANRPGYADEERQRFMRTMRLAGFPACAKPESLSDVANPICLPECST